MESLANAPLEEHLHVYTSLIIRFHGIFHQFPNIGDLMLLLR